MSPINDAVAGYERPEPISETLYTAQNRYLRAAAALFDTEEKYTRREIGAEELKMAHAKAETALGELENVWTTIDSQAKKEERKK